MKKEIWKMNEEEINVSTIESDLATDADVKDLKFPAEQVEFKDSEPSESFEYLRSLV